MSKMERNHLDEILDRMLDIELEGQATRTTKYSEILTLCKKITTNVNQTTAEKLAAVCIQDLTKDLKNSPSALAILTCILNKIKIGQCVSGSYLTPTALAITHMIKKCVLLKTPLLWKLCYDTLHLYPEFVLISLATSHARDFLDIFDFTQLYTIMDKNGESIETALAILIRTLKVLPLPEKTVFVKEGLDVWFKSVLPAITWPRSENPLSIKDNVVALELLVEPLMNVDYADNVYWDAVIQDICNKDRYPNFLQSLVESESACWHRIWIIFIKLLKLDITKLRHKLKNSPINALLPVVEVGFRSDPKNRCKAFQCWNALIDTFSNELDGSDGAIMNKRLKLLITPMKLNNAKVEETVLAKFHTWWHLIRRFRSQMDQLTNTVLIPFLHFCFGKYKGQGVLVSAPGQISRNVANACSEALIEIIGHVNCDGCVTLPRLGERLINTSSLVAYWDDWMHSLGVAMVSLTLHAENTRKYLCLWKGYVTVVAELPDNQIRVDLFNGLLEYVGKVVRQNNMSLEAFNLLTNLFDNDTKIRALLKSKNFSEPLYKIIKLLCDISFDDSFDTEEVIQNLKPVTDAILDASMVPPDDVIIWFLQQTVMGQSKMFLWAALADSMSDARNQVKLETLNDMLIWPLKNLDRISHDCAEVVWYKWYTLYSCARATIDEHIKLVLLARADTEAEHSPLLLISALAALKQKLVSNGDSSEFESDARILLCFMKRINKFKHLDKLLPILVDTTVLLINKACESVNYTLATHCVEIIKIVLNGLKVNARNLVCMEDLLNEIDTFFMIESYASLKPILDQSLTECLKLFNNDSSAPVAEKADMNKNNFIAPGPKTKKAKKSEPNIVSTVVENGEEYVVVKSHWKFNPRKLTENQKEKLKKKREDIPALYQDVLQSQDGQDEFQISSWKTDSQDASTSNTTSRSNDKATINTTILKSMTSTDVVPKIMENILLDTVKTSENVTEKEVVKNKMPKTPSVKEQKTPRMALKERVYRNVRNLIDKSGLQKDKVGIPITEDHNHTVNENGLKTPETKPRITPGATNSAPPKITLERPVRFVKKPKKFENTQIYALKKKQRSQSCSQSPPDKDKVFVSKRNKRSHSGSRSPLDKHVENVDLKEKEQNNHQDHNTDNPLDKLELTNNKLDSMQVATVKEIETVTTDLVVPFVESIDTGVRQAVKLDSDKNDSSVVKITAAPVIKNDAEVITNKVISTENIEIPINKIDIPINENVALTDKNDLPIIEIENSEPTQDAKELDTIKETSEKIDAVIENNTTKKLVPKKNPDNSSQPIEEISTPKTAKQKETGDQPTTKKKQSRIEKELLIDMVKSNIVPLSQTEKRATRKIQPNDTVSKRRKSSIEEKSKKVKAELKSSCFTEKKSKENNVSEAKPKRKQSPATVTDSQDLPESQDIPSSEDVIESSQDSSITTISVKSATKTKILRVDLNKANLLVKSIDTQKLLDDFDNEIIPLSDTLPDSESQEDIELPKNKTMIYEESDRIDKNQSNEKDQTENMDRQPIDSSSDVIIIKESDQTPLVINTEDTVSKETQEMAEADTLPMDIANTISESDANENITPGNKSQTDNNVDNDVTHVSTLETTTSIPETGEAIIDIITESSNTGSPLQQDIQRKKDFLNDTIEISPIKTMSPVKEKTPSSETSSDYVIIKLKSPVQSNGEPYNEECDSPEIFTEEKVSPDKRDQSPPRKVMTVANPSNKKNRPQMWSNGRAAQMLGLCVPETLQTINMDRSNEEAKKTSPVSTPARRNLKILYNAGGNENHVGENESEDSENFFKFKKALPTANSSPAGPILKRKLADIADEATVSPASKRKRVSFHDPPVSTTVSVHKYIEPCGIRSPQNSAIKRQERQLRSLTFANLRKSPKRLDNVFKLETVLDKAVDSFSEDQTVSNETEMSLDETPAVEIIKTNELNDTDPICPELLGCKDPIDNIAGELSSASTKTLLVKELEGTVETVGDLAKMSELEVNRLCIKAPKVKVAKKVLTDYASKIVAKTQALDIVENVVEASITVPEIERVDMEVQTNEMITSDTEMQTVEIPVALVQTQTDGVSSAHSTAQTDESGSRTTKDVISTCLVERPDFVDRLVDQLENTSIQRIAEKLPFDESLALLLQKMTPSNSFEVLNRVLASSDTNGKVDWTILQDYLCSRFESKELLLFCSQLFQKFISDKPA